MFDHLHIPGNLQDSGSNATDYSLNQNNYGNSFNNQNFKFCKKCGNQIPGDSAFCPVCGMNTLDFGRENNNSGRVSAYNSSAHNSAPHKSSIVLLCACIFAAGVILSIGIFLLIKNNDKNNSTENVSQSDIGKENTEWDNEEQSENETEEEYSIAEDSSEELSSENYVHDSDKENNDAENEDLYVDAESEIKIDGVTYDEATDYTYKNGEYAKSWHSFVQEEDKYYPLATAQYYLYQHGNGRIDITINDESVLLSEYNAFDYIQKCRNGEKILYFGDVDGIYVNKLEDIFGYTLASFIYFSNDGNSLIIEGGNFNYEGGPFSEKKVCNSINGESISDFEDYIECVYTENSIYGESYNPYEVSDKLMFYFDNPTTLTYTTYDNFKEVSDSIEIKQALMRVKEYNEITDIYTADEGYTYFYLDNLSPGYYSVFIDGMYTDGKERSVIQIVE